MSSQVVHFHVLADDPDALAGFYEGVFDWRVEDGRLEVVDGEVGGPYRYFGRDTSGISGSVNERELFGRSYPDAREGGVVLVVRVDDLDATLAEAERRGARRVGRDEPDRLELTGVDDADGPFELQAFLDPEGNVVELIHR
ncbi:MAG TPA: VOC family protein [Actinomycetota bacterium]|jgi:predicted enzyme related to lactoylglutathione lyase